MSEILCSTGALLQYGEDYTRLEQLSKQLLYDGYEFMMDRPYYDEIGRLIHYLKKIDLHIPVVHCEKSIGENISKGGKSELQDAYEKFEVNCYLSKSIGAEKMVIHLWDGRTSDLNFVNNLTAYAILGEIAQIYGVDLLVENVVCSVENPMKHICELREKYPGIHFVFDTKMAAFHGQIELLYEKKYEWLWRDGHIRHYHVNDYAGGYMDWANLKSLPIGRGKIDFESFFEYIKRIDYNGTFTVEATAVNHEGVVDLEMLNEQFRVINSFLTKKSA